jgi:hypothetical protein
MGSCVIPDHPPLDRRGIDDFDHSLTSGMDVDVPNFDGLLIAPPITVEDLDHQAFGTVPDQLLLRVYSGARLTPAGFGQI